MAVTVRKRDPFAEKVREGVALLGIYDGSNQDFTTPEPFVQGTNMNIKVYRNGQRLHFGVSNDYVVSESGGPGTGYDTIVVAIPPRDHEKLIADYHTP